MDQSNWNHDYTNDILNAIRPEFNFPFPFELAKHLNRVSEDVFSDSEMESMKACSKQTLECSNELLNVLSSKPGWFDKLIAALKFEEMLSYHNVADRLIELKGEVDESVVREYRKISRPNESKLMRDALRQLHERVDILERDDAEHSGGCLRHVTCCLPVNHNANRRHGHLESKVNALGEQITSAEQQLNEQIEKLQTAVEEDGGNRLHLTAMMDDLKGKLNHLELLAARKKVVFRANLGTAKETPTTWVTLDLAFETVVNEGGGQWSNGKYKLPTDGTYVAALHVMQRDRGEMQVDVFRNRSEWLGIYVTTTGLWHSGTSLAVLDFVKGDELQVGMWSRTGKPRIEFCYLNVFRIA